MEKFTQFIDKYIMPVAAKIGNQRHLSAVRDGFVSIISIVMVGSLAVLINNLPFEGYKKLMIGIFGENWTVLGGNIWWATFAMSAIFSVMTISYSLAKSYGEDGIVAPIIALGAFFTLVPQTVKIPESTESIWGVLDWNYLSQNALFTALIVALVSTEIFVRLAKWDKLVIKMPDGVPPAVSKSFAKLFPGMFTIVAFGILGVLINKFSDGKYLNELINEAVATPLKQMTDSVVTAMLIPFLNQFFWFCGLHGSNILTPIISPLFGPLLQDNQVILNNHGNIKDMAVVAGPFLDAFVYMGGSGTTIGLLIAIFGLSKNKHSRDIAGLGIAPAVFNINEPVIFGMPLVLNPVFVIPFILTPPLLGLISYLAIKSGLVYPVVANIPWTMPPVLGGFFATGGHLSGAVLAAVNLVLSIIIYAPFVVVADRIEMKKESEMKTV